MEWKVKLKELSQSIRWPYDVNNLSDKLINSLYEDQIRSVLKGEYAMLYFSDWHLIFNLINNGQGIAYAYYYSQTIIRRLYFWLREFLFQVLQSTRLRDLFTIRYKEYVVHSNPLDMSPSFNKMGFSVFWWVSVIFDKSKKLIIVDDRLQLLVFEQ